MYISFRLLEGGTLDPSKGRGVDSGRCVHLKGGGKKNVPESFSGNGIKRRPKSALSYKVLADLEFS